MHPRYRKNHSAPGKESDKGGWNSGGIPTLRLQEDTGLSAFILVSEGEIPAGRLISQLNVFMWERDISAVEVFSFSCSLIIKSITERTSGNQAGQLITRNKHFKYIHSSVFLCVLDSFHKVPGIFCWVENVFTNLQRETVSSSNAWGFVEC